MREWLIFDVTNPHFNYEAFVRAVEYPLVSSVLMGLNTMILYVEEFAFWSHVLSPQNRERPRSTPRG